MAEDRGELIRREGGEWSAPDTEVYDNEVDLRQVLLNDPRRSLAVDHQRMR